MAPRQQPQEPDSTADAAEQFLKGLVATFDDEQQQKGLEDLAGMFYTYYNALQQKGFHRSKAFILTRDWHGMWWTAKINHELMHAHQGPQEEEEEN